MPKATPFIAALGIALAHLGYLALAREGSSHDPDRYFHFAVARQTAASGLVRALPQVAGIGWDKSFADKEFLFHALGGIAYRIAGEAGVVAMAELLAILFFLLLFALLRAHASTPAALLILACLFWATPALMTRTVLVRPHILAMVLFVGLALAWQRRRPVASALCCALFALAYHAVYLPLLFLALAAASDWVEIRSRRVAWFGVAGLFAGVLIHPYFPANLLLGLQHLSIALGAQAVPEASLGAELQPLRSDVLLLSYAPHLAVLVAGWFGLGAAQRSDRRDGSADDCWLFIATLMFVLVAKSPRAIEYAAPMVAVLAARLWTGRQAWLMPRAPSIRGGMACGFLLALSGQLVTLVHYWSRPTPPRDDGVARALAVLPPTPRRPTIFNCEWSDGAEILYRRPDVRFFDLLDPTFLAIASPAIHELRQAFRDDRLHDPLTVVRDLLGADYVLCRAPKATARMQVDPGFVRLFSADPSGPALELFAIDHRTGGQFVSQFRSRGRAFPDGEVLSLTPAAFSREAEAPLRELLSDEPTVVSRWLTLAPAAPREGAATPAGGARPDPESDCTWLAPSGGENARAGSTLLGVGGAGFLRVWRNGAPLFDGEGEPSRQVTSLVPLVPALAPDDRIELVICGQRGAPRAVTLSFWTAAEIEATCRAKGLRPPALESFAWSPSPPLCIAPLASGGGRRESRPGGRPAP